MRRGSGLWKRNEKVEESEETRAIRRKERYLVEKTSAASAPQIEKHDRRKDDAPVGKKKELKRKRKQKSLPWAAKSSCGGGRIVLLVFS